MSNREPKFIVQKSLKFSLFLSFALSSKKSLKFRPKKRLIFRPFSDNTDRTSKKAKNKSLKTNAGFPCKWRYNLEGVEFALSGGGDHKVKQKYDNLQSMEKLKEKIA